MSAAQMRWDDPFRTGFAGSYDPGTMYGLYFRAAQGDAAAKHHLAQAGFFDQYGNDTFGASANYHQAVTNWAKQKGLNLYTGPNPFQWNSAWAVDGQTNTAPGFQAAWDAAYNQERLGTQQPNTQPSDPFTQQTPPVGPSLAQGAGGAQVGAGMPDWARYTAGRDGSTYYNVLRGKFDPWGQWGHSGPALNAPKRHQTAQGMESDTDRVYRWTNDILRNMGYAGGENAPPELRTRIFLANVERLKQDYQNLNLDWNTSAFANMDQQVRLTVASGGSGGGTMPGTGTGGTTPGTGGGTGGGGAAPGTTPTTNTGGTGSGLNAAQAGVLSRDPALAYRYMMQQLGYDPSAPGLLGKFLKQQFQPLLEARMAAANVSDDASYLDTLDNTIKDFGSGLFQKGGNFYGNLANIGNQAAQQGAGYLNQLKDQEQAQQYLQQLGMLRYAGTNPLIQQAMADEMRRANETYQDLSFNTEAGQSKNIDPFQQWLLGQSRYRSIFGY